MTLFRARILFVFITGFMPNLGHANEVTYLSEPRQALGAFVQTVREARSSVDLATFIFETCEPSTHLLLEALAEKARSGVRVRLLLDALAQKGAPKQSLVSFLQEAGAEIRFYNTSELNLRMHIKMLVVDKQALIAGGRNISDRYFGLAAHKNYVDRDLLVRGPAALEAALSFEELWKSRNTSLAPKGRSFAGWEKSCGNLSARISRIRDWLAAHTPASSPSHRCDNVRFFADDPSFADLDLAERGSAQDYMTPMRLAKKRSTSAVLRFLDRARSTVYGENWVYMPVGMLGDAFARLRQRQVQTRLITNADTEDGPAFFREAMDYAVKVYSERHSTGSQSVRRISSRGGLSAAHELTPKGAPFFLHGKVLTRDDRDVSVGSFNLDSRSYSMNLESTVMVENCPTLVTEVREHTENLLALHDEDVKSGRVPRKKEASFTARMFAMFTLVFL